MPSLKFYLKMMLHIVAETEKKMQRLKLDFGKRSYDIVINNSFDALSKELTNLCKGKILVVTDTNVALLYKDELSKVICAAGFDKPEFAVFKAGEKSKNIDTIQRIYKSAIESGFSREGTIIAFGGGVVGDIAGFVASTYMRGVNFIQIPTTLLAQTDSSVGGKVGFDFCGAKNIIGAFKQPSLVYINTASLKTLPKREFCSGMAEVIKYGIIKDEGFLTYLEKNNSAICDFDDDAIEDVIYNCCKIKADIVTEDETESGLRAILNFGHTIGHGIESAKNFSLLHGECVALGMLCALDISLSRGYISADEAQRCKKIIAMYELDTNVTNININAVATYMKNDKKKLCDTLRFVLVDGIGNAQIKDDVTNDEIEHALKCIMC